MPSPAPTRSRSPHSSQAAARCGAGRSGTITSAASAWWAGRAQQPIRGGAERRWPCRRNGDGDPADVAADGTAGILRRRTAGDRLRVDLAALEAADRLQRGEGAEV